MNRWTPAAARRLRACVVWLGVTAGAAGLGALATPVVLGTLAMPAPDFVDVLVAGCATAVLGAGSWLWALTTAVVVTVLRDGPALRDRRPGRLRAAVLAACGAAALTSTTPATAASAGSSAPLSAPALAGLTLPDGTTNAGAGRAVGVPASGDLTAPAPAAESGRSVRVRPGDSLWRIAEQQVGRAAREADVASYWLRLRALNAASLGEDPDLLLPGQRLVLPPTVPLTDLPA